MDTTKTPDDYQYKKIVNLSKQSKYFQYASYLSGAGTVGAIILSGLMRDADTACYVGYSGLLATYCLSGMGYIKAVQIDKIKDQLNQNQR